MCNMGRQVDNGPAKVRSCWTNAVLVDKEFRFHNYRLSIGEMSNVNIVVCGQSDSNTVL